MASRYCVTIAGLGLDSRYSLPAPACDRAVTLMGCRYQAMSRASDSSGQTGRGPVELAKRIRAQTDHKHLAVFLDYDGTLTPIVDRPELAVLEPGVRAVLSELADRCPTAILSGRSLADVRGLVGVISAYYGGNHGLEIEGPPNTHIKQEKGAEVRPELELALKRIEEGLDNVPGVLVEDKGLSLSVHYRLAADKDVPAIQTVVDQVLEDLPSLRRHSGKKVYEVRPRIDWDKGKALLWMLEVLGLDGDDVFPIYIGDDDTDEDAFRVLSGRGLSILVSSEPRVSLADYQLHDPDEVCRLLGLLTPATQSMRR